MCLSEGSKIVIDACESFLISMLLPPISSSPSVASTVVTDRYHTPSPLTSGYQTPCEDVPPIPAKIISILQVNVTSTAPSLLSRPFRHHSPPLHPQAQANEMASTIKHFSKSSIDMLVADVLQNCIDLHRPLDLRACLRAKATLEMLLQCMQDPKGPMSRDMNEWEKLKRSCWRFAALMRVLSVAVPTMQGGRQYAPGTWVPQLVVVREPKVLDELPVGAEEEKELWPCWSVQAQRQKYRLWIRDSCVLLCVAHPSELQKVIVKHSYGLNRLNEAEFAKAMLPREQVDRDRCLLLTVRPTVERLGAAAVGKHAAISTLVNDEMLRTPIAFETEDKAAAALEHIRRSHAAFKERQKVSLEKVLLTASDLSE